MKLVRQTIVANDDDLGMGLREMHGGDPIGGGKDPELSGKAGQQLQRLLRFLAIARLVGESVQPKQRDGSHGISRGRGRILKRLAARAQHSQIVFLSPSRAGRCRRIRRKQDRNMRSIILSAMRCAKLK